MTAEQMANEIAATLHQDGVVSLSGEEIHAVSRDLELFQLEAFKAGMTHAAGVAWDARDSIAWSDSSQNAFHNGQLSGLSKAQVSIELSRDQLTKLP